MTRPKPHFDKVVVVIKNKPVLLVALELKQELKP
jgi:hypothetical protein